MIGKKRGRRARNDDEVKDNGNKNKFKLTEKNNRETSAKYLYDYYGNLSRNSNKRRLLAVRNENHMCDMMLYCIFDDDDDIYAYIRLVFLFWDMSCLFRRRSSFI